MTDPLHCCHSERRQRGIFLLSGSRANQTAPLPSAVSLLGKKRFFASRGKRYPGEEILHYQADGESQSRGDHGNEEKLRARRDLRLRRQLSFEGAHAEER